MLPIVTGEFRVIKDPELRYSPSGVAVATVRAVANKQKQNEKGEWVDDKECWVNIKAFNRIAENVAESFEKKDLIFVTGKLETDEWEDKDGNKRTSVNLIADSVGPSIRWNAAHVQRTERGTSKTEKAVSDSTFETAPPTQQDDDPPF